MLKSRKILIFGTYAEVEFVKIYDYNGKKNICGERVHEARCRLRLTQSDLAAKLQIKYEICIRFPHFFVFLHKI